MQIVALLLIGAAVFAVILIVAGVVLSVNEKRALSERKRRTAQMIKPLSEFAEAEASPWLAAPESADESPWVQVEGDPDRMTFRLRLMMLTMPFGIAVLGVVAVVVAALWYGEYGASESWPSVTGQITDNAIREVRDRSTSRRSNRRYNYDYDYVVTLQYAYTVGGQQYSSNRIAFSANALFGQDRITFSTESSAERYLAKHAKGQQVAVYYNPDNPAKAVLERRIDTLFLALSAGGGMVAVVVGAASTLGGIVPLFRRR